MSGNIALLLISTPIAAFFLWVTLLTAEDKDDR